MRGSIALSKILYKFQRSRVLGLEKYGLLKPKDCPVLKRLPEGALCKGWPYRRDFERYNCPACEKFVGV